MMNCEATTATIAYVIPSDEECGTAPADANSRRAGTRSVRVRRWARRNDAGVTDYATDVNNSTPFSEHRQKLGMLESDPSLAGEADAPNAFSIAWAEILLDQLERMQFVPTRVVASAENGIALCFVAGGRYADVECLNSGEIMAVTSERGEEPEVWTVPQSIGALTDTLLRIRNFIRG